MTLELDALHDHCERCIKITKCSVQPVAGRSCPIVSCPLHCTARFHACKTLEHKLLCPNEQVACLNKEYGCTEKIHRRHISKHLHTCPANVICCRIQWTRSPASQHAKVLQVQENNKQLDVAFVLRDQRLLRKKLEAVENDFSKKQSLQSSTADSSIVERADMNAFEYTIDSDARLLNGSTDGSDCNDCNSRFSVSLNLLNTSPIFCLENLIPTSGQPVKIVLDMNISCVSGNDLSIFSSPYFFSCAQVFRRDEYNWHCQNFHNDILGSTCGWIEERCPLLEYGCQFSLRRLHPEVPKDSTLIYNLQMESLGLKPPPHPADKMNGVVYNNCDKYAKEQEDFKRSEILLTDLPFEILHHICAHLDSFSLTNLSQTCHVLRHICNSLLKENGLVVVLWTKKKTQDRTTWQKAGCLWHFSSAFTPIKKWHYGSEEHMSNHLKNCPYFERNTHSRSREIMEKIFKPYFLQNPNGPFTPS